MYGYDTDTAAKLTMHASMHACNNVVYVHRHQCNWKACAGGLVCFNSHSFSWLKRMWIYIL